VVRSRLSLVPMLLLATLVSGCALGLWGRRAPEKPAATTPPPPAAPRPEPKITVVRPPQGTGRDTRERTPPSALSRVAADTLAARSAVRRCAGRKLLPDQESTYEATLQLLRQARDAIRRHDLPAAESLARRARLLSGSLGC